MPYPHRQVANSLGSEGLVTHSLTAIAIRKLFMNRIKLTLLVLALTGLLTPALQAQSTAFTYQGRLDGSAGPVNGTYDLTFGVFSVSSGAGQVGSTLTKSGTLVTNGLFTVTLDFGNQFSGADRWLEIGVRTNGAPSFVTLAPRQPLTSTPHAITAVSVSGSVSAANLTGSVPSASLTSVPAENLTGSVPSASLTSVPAGNLTGTMGDARLSANVALRSGGNTFTGNQSISGFLGIGTTTPNANLEVLSSSTAEIVGTAHGSQALFIGQKANGSPASPTAVQSGNELAWFGARGYTGSGFSGTRAAMKMQASENWTGSANGADLLFANTPNGSSTSVERMRITQNGFVGIGTATPVASLQVSSSNPQIYVTASGGGYAQFIGQSANGSLDTPTAVTSGQNLVWFGAQGHDGVSYSASRAAIMMRATQNWTTSAKGTEMLFATAVNGTDTRTNAMIITHDGRVGIGTSSPDALLSVNGTASKPGGGSWNTFSDRRLKDVNVNFNRGLEALSKIQPVHYHYKPGNPLELPSGPDYVGVIAQQVEQAVPEAIERTKDGYLTVNNDPIMWTMFNAIKELNQKVDEKDARIQKQDAENAALKARLDRLEQLLTTQTGSSK